MINGPLKLYVLNLVWRYIINITKIVRENISMLKITNMATVRYVVIMSDSCYIAYIYNNGN
jgi:hypothetical protein